MVGLAGDGTSELAAAIDGGDDGDRDVFVPEGGALLDVELNEAAKIFGVEGIGGEAGRVDAMGCSGLEVVLLCRRFLKFGELVVGVECAGSSAAAEHAQIECGAFFFGKVDEFQRGRWGRRGCGGLPAGRRRPTTPS